MTESDVAQPNRFASLRSLAVLAVVPTIIMVGLLWQSPNFNPPDQSSEDVLSYPLGGDYLQEYVAGQLLLDPSTRSQLYDADIFQVAQHDPARVGFTWDDQQFFPAVYPPFWYAVVSPLSKLSSLVAAKIWLVLMTIALVAAAWLLSRYANVPVPLLMVMCLAAPVIQSLNAGQKGSVLLLILCGTYVLWKQQRPVLSGLVFSLIAFKPHLGIAIGLWMLVSGNWRWVAGTFAGLAVLAIASFFIGSGLVSDYLNVVTGFGDYVQSGGYNLHESFSLWSFWQQLVPSPAIAKVLTIISSLAVLVVSLFSFRYRETLTTKSSDADRAFAAMVIVTIVTSPHLYAYDLTILLLPIGLLVKNALELRTEAKNPIVWVPAGLLALLMFANGFFTSFALTTGIQIGVLLLLAAWLTTTRLAFEVSAHAD